MDVYGSVREFEKALMEYSGAPYAVGVDSCSNALALCCQYRQVKAFLEIEIPAITYPSVAAAVVHAGGRIKFDDRKWQHLGWFVLQPTGIVDSAKYLARNMFNEIKDMIFKILNKEGIVITFGYHSVSMGKTRGFIQDKVLLMSHGGAIHDTIAVVERMTALEAKRNA